VRVYESGGIDATRACLVSLFKQ